jgi:type IV pilus assembly protein PilE
MPALRLGRFLQRDGYSTRELLTVLALIVLLMAVAVPSYFGIKKKALATEARASLHRLFELQLSYREANGSYTDSLGDLGFRPTPDLRYTYEIYSLWPSGFSARALSNLDSDLEFDVWTIDHTGSLRHVTVD